MTLFTSSQLSNFVGFSIGFWDVTLARTEFAPYRSEGLWARYKINQGFIKALTRHFQKKLTTKRTRTKQRELIEELLETDFAVLRKFIK